MGLMGGDPGALDGAKAAFTHPAHDRMAEFLAEVTEARESVTYEVTR